jgi:predicted oxidoreductase (fatty acid repression mutant protein)
MFPAGTVLPPHHLPLAAAPTHAPPCSFNSQTARAIVLLGAEHRKLWDITTECLRAIVPAEAFPVTEKKMQGFKSAYGTVLWFEDQTGVKAMQDAFPTYADKFPIFSEHASGMNQYVAWTALEAEGFGANLQVGPFPLRPPHDTTADSRTALLPHHR